jgi:hypothetical protein
MKNFLFSFGLERDELMQVSALAKELKRKKSEHKGR